jgi:hypothetical protein
MATELFRDVEIACMHVPGGTMKGKPDV